MSSSSAISKRYSGLFGGLDQTCPRLFVTVHVGVHTYASSQPSSLTVTTIRSSLAIGEYAIRTLRRGLPVVDSSVAGALQEVPSHDRVFGLLTVFVPVFDRYDIQASSPKVFDSLQATCGLLLESVETVGMNPGLVSSTLVTACQFAAFASWVSVG